LSQNRDKKLNFAPLALNGSGVSCLASDGVPSPIIRFPQNGTQKPRSPVRGFFRLELTLRLVCHTSKLVCRTPRFGDSGVSPLLREAVDGSLRYGESLRPLGRRTKMKALVSALTLSLVVAFSAPAFASTNGAYVGDMIGGNSKAAKNKTVQSTTTTKPHAKKHVY
jgi:hypothetical protein